MRGAKRLRMGLAVVWVLVAVESASAALSCPADCDANGAVTIDELLKAVGIGLGTRELRDCSACDVDAGGAVTIDELVLGVNAALDGCAPVMAGLASGRCLACHAGIEAAHPRHPLGCTQCHGGNPRAAAKEDAHVQPRQPLPRDATILPVDYGDREYLQFVNPTNLRVARSTCGQAQGGGACHASYVEDLLKSMMATTAGHLTGGGYQSGILPSRAAQWANFPIADGDGEVPYALGALTGLAQIPSADAFGALPLDSYQRNFADVPRKVCTRCHLWSRGAAVRGVPGQEGNYRSEGCAACHMPYSNAALSESADPTIDKTEVGHPRRHQLTRRIPTDQCTHCHTRGARIGLSYRGLAQLPPGTPVGAGYAGLTPEKIHGSYQVQNPAVNPPDVHYERGLHCIDCHVRREVMGDGNIYGHMDQATEIECDDCHGTPEAYGTMVSGRGTPLTNLRWEAGRMVLTSKVTGREHVVKQVKDIVDPSSPGYNPLAARAMNANHLKADGGLECYTCHSAWQNNCYGCHFNRDLGQSALDMVAGESTPGKPVLDDRYFVNFKNFHMGYNAEGKVAPYVTGCQVLATVKDAAGRPLLVQEPPVTAAGLSGLALNPVHPHTNRRAARGCVECHRNPAALGLGTDGFDLSRAHLFALSPAPAGALAVIDRRSPADSRVIASLALPDPRALVVRTDQISGRAEVAYVGDASLGLVAVDVSDPAHPRVTGTAELADPRDLALAGKTLFAAAGANGVIAFDVGDALAPRRLGAIATTEARGLAVHGLHLLVADGAAGLTVVSVADPAQPRIAAVLDLNGEDPATNDARAVATLPDYSDPIPAGIKPFTMIAYVAAGAAGVHVVNLDEPERPFVIANIPTRDARAVFAKSQYTPGSPTEPSLEREYLYVADGDGGVVIAEVSDPWSPAPVLTHAMAGPVYDLRVFNAFEPPNNKTYLYAGLGGGGFGLFDISSIREPALVATLPVTVWHGIDLERIMLDRMIDEDGTQIKDTSHEGARPFRRAEIERILRAEF